MEKKKYLIDASIIASSVEDFKRRFTSATDCTLVLSDLSFRELEARKIDKNCEYASVSFARFLIDLFVRDRISTEICLIENEICGKHIDESLVKYAKTQGMSVLTCDKGMALWCRFYDVDCELLEIRSIATLPFIHQSGSGSLYLNLKQVPIGYSTFVYSPEKNKIMSSLGSDIMFLIPGNILLVAQPEQKMCCIQTYFINKDFSISLVGKNLYSSEEDIDSDTNPFHINLYDKWTKHIAKHNI